LPRSHNPRGLSRNIAFACLAALFLLTISAAWAQLQSSRGAIQGTVLDATGAAVPGVHVSATLVESGITRQTDTDLEGNFRFSGLQVGGYRLTFEKQGFSSVVVKDINVSLGQTVVQRISMTLAQVTERLEITDQAPALDVGATSASVALGTERVEETPSQNRSFLNIVLTAPGVATSAGSNAQRSAIALRSASTDSGFSFGGMRGRNNSLSIDGVDNRDETTGGNRVAVGLEMVHEFRVSGTSFAAESGGASGGAVNLVTMSGTNTWHGDGTYFTQNEFSNARNPEADSSVNPRFRRYQPGTSLNGPIQRDRTFISLALEQEWESGQEWSDTPRVLSGSKLFPGVTPYRGLFDTNSSQTEFALKVTHQATQRSTISARYAFSLGSAHHDVQDVENFTDESARGNSLTRDHSLTGEWIFVISPSVMNDLRGQFAERSVGLTPNSNGPMYDVPGVVTFGQGYRLNARRREKHAELAESLHISRGRHQIGFGVSAHEVRLDARIANKFGGIYIYPTVDRLLANRPDEIIQAFGNPATRINTIPLGFWIQDSWQIGRGLTLEGGLRYDHQFLPAAIPSTNKNLAPRIGLAWHPSPDSPYVFRAGFGLFCDRYPLAYLNDAIQKDGANAYELYTFDGLAPMRARYQASSDFPATYSRKITAGAERSFGKDTTLTLEYSSVLGRHLPRIRNINYPGTPPLFQLEQTANSSFNGLSVALNKRLSKEFAYLFSYNLSSTHDDGSDFDEQPMDPRNIARDWAFSRQHQLNRFTGSALFEPIDHVTLAPTFTTGSGRPLNALETSDTLRTGAYPMTVRPDGFARNPFFMRGITSLDARLMYTIPVHEKRAVLQFGAEAFNILNHTNPVRSSPFLDAQGVRLSFYRREVETLNARQIQFFMQFEY
jgi:hypothetical protein